MKTIISLQLMSLSPAIEDRAATRYGVGERDVTGAEGVRRGCGVTKAELIITT